MLHIRNKDQACATKSLEKEEAVKAESKKCVATFDLQQVLNCPHGDLSVYFYKLQLSLYNLTMNLGSKHATCYLWNETVAECGTCEIGSCLF